MQKIKNIFIQTLLILPAFKIMTAFRNNRQPFICLQRMIKILNIFRLNNRIFFRGYQQHICLNSATQRQCVVCFGRFNHLIRNLFSVINIKSVFFPITTER